MNLDLIIHLYSAFSLIFCSLLVFLIYKVHKTKNGVKKHTIFTLHVIVHLIVAYICFLYSQSHGSAMLFYSLFLTGTAISVYAVFIFTLAYTNMSRKLRPLSVLLLLCCIADCALILMNFKTLFIFDIEQGFTSLGYSYWAVNYLTGNLVHMGYSYIVTLLTFMLLCVNIFRSSTAFKNTSITIIAVYTIIMITNYICYTMGVPLDISIFLLAAFTYPVFNYTSTYYQSQLILTPLSSINETITDAIICFDYSGRLVYSNKAAKEVFSARKKDFNEYLQQFRVFYLEEHPKELTLELENGENHHYITEYKDFYIKNSFIGSYLKLEDKTEEIAESQHRRYIATHDTLTGLLNRSGFFEAAQTALTENYFKNPMIICSNIKDFRLINDIYGEEWGDEVLKTQAMMMVKYAHKKNINGRLADDKFAILMEKTDFKPEIFEDAYKDLSTLTANGVYHMSISAGVYEIYNRHENIQIIYDKAKLAMDAIKNDYQKIFSYYDSTMMDHLLAEKNIINDFETALDDMQFDIHLQPVINKDGKSLGAEALVRWKHPREQLLYPSDFIGALENAGLIHKLDMYVWDLAAKKLKDWIKRGFTDRFISINVSEKDLLYIDIPQILIDLTAKYQIPPENLHIESQEKALAAKPEEALKIFSRLKAEGFKVYVDHFGSGWSSLNMLKNFDVDGIKIDLDFLKDEEFSEKNRIILQSIFNMAADLNMDAVAEGVETKTQLKTLTQMNCQLFQGFYWARALPIREYETLYLK